MSTQMDKLVAFAQRDGRVCPQAPHWEELWELLPNRKQLATGWQPPVPLIFRAWWYTSNESKRDRFLYHIQWAADHGALERIARFIESLRPDQWYYEGE